MSEFVKCSPSFYNKIFRSKYGDDAVRAELENSNGLDDVAEYAKRANNVLFNLVNIYTYSASLDTSLLKTLVALQFKIKIIRNDPVSPDSDVIIPKILNVINSVRKYESLNCGIPSVLSYGNESGNGNGATDDILDLIKPLNLETSDEQCDAKRMLLGRVMESDDTESRNLSGMSVRTSFNRDDQGKVTIKDVYQLIDRTEDLELIFWYQSIVFDAIIRSLCVRLVPSVDRDRISVGLRGLDFIYSDMTILPVEVVDSFKVLASDGEPIEVQQSALNELRRYRVGRISYSAETDVAGLPFYFLNYNDARYRKSKAEPFLNEIVRYKTDYKCFVRMYALLHNDYKKYYVPRGKPSFRRAHKFVNDKICDIGAKDEPTIDLPSNLPMPNPVLVDRRCDLVSILYRYCIESIIALNNWKTVFLVYTDRYIVSIVYNVQSILYNLSAVFGKFDLVPLWKMIETRLI